MIPGFFRVGVSRGRDSATFAAMIFPLGSLINALAIVVGAVVGVLLGQRLTDRLQNIAFQAIGLCILILGLQMALKTNEILITIAALLLGGLIGEGLRLESRLTQVADGLKARLRSDNPKFAEGLVTAVVLYCVGSLAILGPIDEGLRGDRTLLYTKTLLDGFSAVILASAYGRGVAFSALPVLVYQGIITLSAGLSASFFTDDMIRELSAAGGILIVGIGINMLEIKHIRVTNLLPGLPIVLGLLWAKAHWGPLLF